MKEVLSFLIFIFILSAIIFINSISAQSNHFSDKTNKSYLKGSWSVYFHGIEIENASSSSFKNSGGDYGKDSSIFSFKF